MSKPNICTVSEMARAMMLHASLRWKDGIVGDLWPITVDYSTYVYHHLPNDKGTALAELFTSSTVPRHIINHIHVFGCPVYVLDPVLQAGKKIPRWKPHSRRGVFVGFSPRHSSNVPLILNRQIGSISPSITWYLTICLPR